MSIQGRIIAFGAHNDDIEVRAGGTVAKYARAGYEVTYVVLIDSVYVSKRYSPPGKRYEDLSHEDILNIRQNESRRGAKILGTREPVFFHFKPSYYWTNETTTSNRVHFYNDDELIENMKRFKGKYFCLEAAHTHLCVNEIADFIRDINPEIVLTQQPNDLHLEHYATSSLAYQACRKLASEGLRLKLYAWEMGSQGKMIRFVPEVIIDVSDAFKIKTEALRNFLSQVGDNPSLFIDYAIRSGRYWGKKIGVEYGEPFSEMLIHNKVIGFELDAADFDRSSIFTKKCRMKF